MRSCACVFVHGQPTVILLLYYFFLLYLIIIIIIHNFNILPVRLDIYFFLHFNIRNMKQARFKLFNIELSV